MAAVVWLCGPPCRPGKTALSSALACSSVLMIIAPRGPRRVLWVVVVMTSACPTGERVRATGHQAGDVRDVGHQHGADLAGDLGERREVDGPRDRGAAAEDHLRPLGESQLAHVVHVDPAGLLAHAVLHRAEPLAGGGHAPAVGEVAAGGQRHAHDRLARGEEGEVDGQVGRRAGVGLHVGVLHAEQRLGPLDRQRLDLVDHLLALVVALAGVALGVLVGQHRPGRLEHRGGDVVLRRDQAHRVALALGLGRDEVGDLGVGVTQVRVAGGVLVVGHGTSVATPPPLVPAPPRQVEGVLRPLPGRQVPGLLGQRAQQLPVAPPGAEPGHRADVQVGGVAPPGPVPLPVAVAPDDVAARMPGAGSSRRRGEGPPQWPSGHAWPRRTRSGRRCSAARGASRQLTLGEVRGPSRLAHEVTGEPGRDGPRRSHSRPWRLRGRGCAA